MEYVQWLVFPVNLRFRSTAGCVCEGVSNAKSSEEPPWMWGHCPVDWDPGVNTKMNMDSGDSGGFRNFL